MGKQLLMGNEAIARAALAAGVDFVSGYPGTPSTEILETVAKYRDESVYVEWSVNEKAAVEAAAGASYAGARSLVTMKQVGLNVAADPVVSLAYVGVNGGMVIVAADDPGPISSQTEQDTRTFARFAKLPVFDPSSPEEAYLMTQDAFAYSEKYQTPVLLRPTTRVCHSCSDIEAAEQPAARIAPSGFVKDTQRWVIFPRASYLNHLKLEDRYAALSDDFSAYRFNTLTGSGHQGVAAGGVSYAYIKEALAGTGAQPKLLKIATAYPFPEKLALDFLDGLDEVIVFEELDPVIERELLLLCGRHGLRIKINGKLNGATARAGENSVENMRAALFAFLGLALPPATELKLPDLPARPPVLCAGCPHRAAFYAVKQAAQGKKAVFSGDIGCYTLGNAPPLDMVDTCLCMGADVTIAQGLHRAEPDALNFAFIGDSTFFASGITGVINAVYNQTEIILVVLDNSATAMTGHQPHPGIGRTMMGQAAEKISIAKILEAVGLSSVQTVDPLDHAASMRAVRDAMALPGVRAIIFASPCAAVTKPAPALRIDRERCTNCQKCLRQLGCPALVAEEGGVMIEPALCFGCALCAQVCPTGAIRSAGKEGRG